jgi:hypothetical protein
LCRNAFFLFFFTRWDVSSLSIWLWRDVFPIRLLFHKGLISSGKLVHLLQDFNYKCIHFRVITLIYLYQCIQKGLDVWFIHDTVHQLSFKRVEFFKKCLILFALFYLFDNFLYIVRIYLFIGSHFLDQLHGVNFLEQALEILSVKLFILRLSPHRHHELCNLLLNFIRKIKCRLLRHFKLQGTLERSLNLHFVNPLLCLFLFVISFWYALDILRGLNAWWNILRGYSGKDNLNFIWMLPNIALQLFPWIEV